MFLEPIRKNTINHGDLSFGKSKGMLIERYFDITKNGLNQREEIHLYLEKFKFKVENTITITFIYLDTTKKVSPKEKFELAYETFFPILHYNHQSDNNQKIPIYPKIKDMELWKIKIELDKCDEVKFYATWK